MNSRPSNSNRLRSVRGIPQDNVCLAFMRMCLYHGPDLLPHATVQSAGFSGFLPDRSDWFCHRLPGGCSAGSGRAKVQETQHLCGFCRLYHR